MFDAAKEQPEIPSIGAMAIINQMHMSLWGNASLQSSTHPRQFDVFPVRHHMAHPRSQQLQRQNSVNRWTLEPIRDHEMKVELKSDYDREAVAAVALMNLANRESGEESSIHD